MTNPRITFTGHAEAMLVERDIDRDLVDRTIRRPDELEPESASKNTFGAFRSIPERDGRALRVASSQTDDRIRVITAFFDRARRRR